MSEEALPDAPRHVVFRVGHALYALPLESVREVVVPRPPFVRVPRAPHAVRGAMNLRGRVVAVVDLAEVLGIPRDVSNLEHVVMLDRGRRALGFSVGPVLGVETLQPSATEPITLLDPDLLEAQASALFAPL